MSRKHLSAANLALPSDPSSLDNGDVWYRSDSHILQFRQNGGSQIIPTVTFVQQYAPKIDQRSTDSSGITSTTLVDVLTTTVTLAGTYTFVVEAQIQASPATATPGIAIGGTSTPTSWRYIGYQDIATAGTDAVIGAQNGTTYLSSGTALVSIGSTTNRKLYLTGNVVLSAAGTMTFRLSRTAGTGTIFAKNGSKLTVQLVG